MDRVIKEEVLLVASARGLWVKVTRERRCVTTTLEQQLVRRDITRSIDEPRRAGPVVAIIGAGLIALGLGIRAHNGWKPAPDGEIGFDTYLYAVGLPMAVIGGTSVFEDVQRVRPESQMVRLVRPVEAAKPGLCQDSVPSPINVRVLLPGRAPIEAQVEDGEEVVLPLDQDARRWLSSPRLVGVQIDDKPREWILVKQE